MSTHHATEPDFPEPRAPGPAKGRWHPQYAACQGCGRTDRAHIARGFCENCYRKTRAAERRRAEGHGVTLAAPARRSTWHHEHAACVACGGTTRPHLSDGLCIDCYRARRVPGDRGHEELPLYQPAVPPPPAATTAATIPAPPVAPTPRRDEPFPPADAPWVGAQAARSAPASPNGVAERHRGDLPDPAPAPGTSAVREDVVLAPAPPVDAAARPAAPRLFARHIRLIRTYAITCPNCGELVRNGRTGGETFQEGELPPGTEIACGRCGAWWGITLE